MNLPDGLQKLTTYAEVKQAWGDLFTFTMREGGEEIFEGEGLVLFANEPRVAITADAIFVKLRRPVKAGPNLELTDVLRINEPTVNALRQTDKYKGDVEKAVCLLGTICGLPTAEIDKMPASDFKLVGEVIGAFL